MAPTRSIIITILSSLVLTSLQSSSCPQGMLAVYRLSLQTEWSEEKFPKQYPQWRPSAQWSKTVGKSGSGYCVDKERCTLLVRWSRLLWNDCK